MGVKTFYNSPLGNPNKLIEELRRKGIDVVFSDFPCANSKLLNMSFSEGISYKDIPFILRLSYMVFEFIPKNLVLEKPRDMYSLYFGPLCLPFLSDMPVVASFWQYDLPPYSFVLGKRRNLIENRSCDELSPKDLKRSIPLSGKIKLSAYLYSERGFFLPGDTIKEKATYVLKVDKDKILVIIEKNGKLFGVYDQNIVNENLNAQGYYSVRIYTYTFRLGRFYFGIRFLGCLPTVRVE
ncbi:MAG: hypothetical protein ACK4SM_02945 [Aquificaceae bacterium]